MYRLYIADARVEPFEDEKFEQIVQKLTHSFLAESMMRYLDLLINIKNHKIKLQWNSKSRMYEIMRLVTCHTVAKLLAGARIPVYDTASPDRVCIFDMVYVDKTIFPKEICFPRFRTKKRNMIKDFKTMMRYFYFFYAKAYYKL